MEHIADSTVESLGDALSGCNLLLGISGGIAATQSVKVLRELRRYGAEPEVMMTHSAQRVITPLAIEWAAGKGVVSDWESRMSSLDDVEAVLVAPATRNLMAKLAHGVIDSPLLMALSSARSREVPVMLVPSMHVDLKQDPLTAELELELQSSGIQLLWDSSSVEGKFKQPSAVSIVAEFCNLVNNSKPQRRSVVITLGATKSAIDDIRHVQNTSSGRTGFEIAEAFHRNGHEVTVVAGHTSVTPAFELPLVISAEHPNEMLTELKALTTCSIDAWIHTAAVLDYLVEDRKQGKHPSGEKGWSIALQPGPKHLTELRDLTADSTRIGFKLESGIKLKQLLLRAGALAEHHNLTAVIANRLEDLDTDSKPRAHLVMNGGESFILKDIRAICEALLSLVESA